MSAKHDTVHSDLGPSRPASAARESRELSALCRIEFGHRGASTSDSASALRAKYERRAAIVRAAARLRGGT